MREPIIRKQSFCFFSDSPVVLVPALLPGPRRQLPGGGLLTQRMLQRRLPLPQSARLPVRAGVQKYRNSTLELLIFFNNSVFHLKNR